MSKLQLPGFKEDPIRVEEQRDLFGPPVLPALRRRAWKQHPYWAMYGVCMVVGLAVGGTSLWLR